MTRCIFQVTKVRFTQGAYRSAVHGTISVLKNMMEDPEAARKTTLIKYLTNFQKETDINLFVLDIDHFGKRMTGASAAMPEHVAYRLTGKFLKRFIG